MWRMVAEVTERNKTDCQDLNKDSGVQHRHRLCAQLGPDSERPQWWLLSCCLFLCKWSSVQFLTLGVSERFQGLLHTKLLVQRPAHSKNSTPRWFVPGILHRKICLRETLYMDFTFFFCCQISVFNSMTPYSTSGASSPYPCWWEKDGARKKHCMSVSPHPWPGYISQWLWFLASVLLLAL